MTDLLRFLVSELPRQHNIVKMYDFIFIFFKGASVQTHFVYSICAIKEKHSVIPIADQMYTPRDWHILET